jgi:hypothetical protein
VVIAAVGLLTALQMLLDSPPDAASPLTGFELVRVKVRQLVSMGMGSYPSGTDPFNWRMDVAAAARVLNDWPAPLVVSEWGSDIFTGSELHARTPHENPIRTAYEIYLGGPGKNRPSWDLAAVLYAVRGAASPFRAVTGSRIRFDPHTGQHHWLPDQPDSQHSYLQPLASNEAIAAELNELMVSPTGKPALIRKVG